jgi:osmotically-inducible protein OsmY
MKKPDTSIQQDVIDELTAESDLDASTIGVAVKNGMVHLVGQVTTLADQQTAERAAHRVAGARGIVDHLKVESTVTARARPQRKRRG